MNYEDKKTVAVAKLAVEEFKSELRELLKNAISEHEEKARLAETEKGEFFHYGKSICATSLLGWLR